MNRLLADKIAVSVIIPARNAAEPLKACLESLQNQQDFELNQDYEVIVVDDGSTDNTCVVAQKYEVELISQENAGPAAARNAGARMARGQILAFTDADCIPAPDWLSQLTRPFQDAAVVGVKGAYQTRETGWIPRFVQLEYAYKYERMKKLPSIDFIDTYSAAYRRDVFLENGGFDQAFPVPSVEDQEFSFRLHNKGYWMVFQPNAFVFHPHDRNFLEYVQRKYLIGYWKAVMLRWLPGKALDDSHTSPSQRLQIGLLGLFLIALVLGLQWHICWAVGLFLLFLFCLSGYNLGRFIFQNDRSIFSIFLPLLLSRAAALAFGLLAGFLFPPRQRLSAHQGPDLVEYFVKRSLDIIGGIVGIILSAPILLGCGIAIKLDSRGSIFFFQERAGEKGHPFRMVKLRSMIAGADQRLSEVLAANALASPVFKIPNDPRVTKVGRFLRRWSLDELPQFWNVLKGEMSLVGPRPEETWVVAQYNDEQRKRLVVKPGLTGPMQISGRGDLNLEERLAVELDYIQNYSLWRDVQILWKTIWIVIEGKGAA